MNTPAKDSMANIACDNHDFARAANEKAVASGDSQQSGAKRSSARLADQNFPVKLHYVLTELEREGKSHIAGFLPHGRAFKVFKPKEFVDEVLQCWFRQTKFASFQRQLNIYGFTRITAGPDANACYHECFLRGMPELANRIQRMAVKGQGPRPSGVDLVAPNFYGMPFLPVAHRRVVGLPTSGKVEANVSSVQANHVALENRIALPVRMESMHGIMNPCSLHIPNKLLEPQAATLADAVLAISERRQVVLDSNSSAPLAPPCVNPVSTKALVLQSIVRRQCQQRHELRLQLEQRLLEERQGGPDLPNVLRAALFSLRNETL